MIRIARDSGYVDLLRVYKVVLDSNVIGEIRGGQTLDFDVPEGIHQLMIKIDWCSSNTLVFENTGNLIEFECGSNLRGLKLFLSLLYITFLNNQYIWLRQKS